MLKKRTLITVVEIRKVFYHLILDYQEEDQDDDEGPRNVKCAHQ
jgi:hypothetical protein